MNHEESDNLGFAYADGELDDYQAARVEAFLQSSPEARARLEADRLLKASLARSFAAEQLPPGFAERAFAALEPPAPGRAPQVRRIAWWTAVSALAACLALWFALPGPKDSPRRQAGSAGPASLKLASLIEKTHLGCAAQGQDHHCKDLPRDDLEVIRRVMSEKLRLAVLAPDLGAADCDFQTANYCGLSDLRGAHLIYRKTDRRVPLSVMTIESMSDEIACGRVKPYRGRRYYLLAGETTCVVAWDQGGATYLLCAALPEGELLKLADPLRLALSRKAPGTHSAGPVSSIRLAGLNWNGAWSRSMNQAWP